MTDNQSIDIAAMLCSRLCHDMLSPVGAFSNGLELLAMESDPKMRANIVALLEESATLSTTRLKFFRLAFGAASNFGERVDVAEIRALIEGLLADKQGVTVNWTIETANLGKVIAKILLNLAQISSDVLVRGGTLDIGVETRDGSCEIVVRAAGPKIAFDDTIGKALDGSLPASQISSRTVAAHMIALLAQEAGGGLQYVRTEDALVLGAVIPEDEGLIG